MHPSPRSIAKSHKTGSNNNAMDKKCSLYVKVVRKHKANKMTDGIAANY